ncbi:DUF221-domain-containing protein [Peniophora sp. CONT]|nr:DUF221-domain-containing protein [Peniophora sp. CONT]
MSSVSATTANSSTSSTFVTSLVFNAAIFAAEILAFTILRRYFKLIYEPRSLSVLEYKRQAPLSSHILGWPLSIWRADYRAIKNINGLDAYFFVRFLRMMIRILIVIWPLSWAILLPITSVGTSVSTDGLTKFTFGNIAPQVQSRYWAHLVCAWVFNGWICWNLKHEYAHFISVRQHFLVSPAHSSTAQARTVLVTGIPPKYLSESALSKLFAHLPGGVERVWLNRDLGDMPDIYKRNVAACKKLESAHTSIFNTATKNYNKRNKKAAKASKKSKVENESTTGLTKPTSSDPEALRALVDELVPAKKRPSHRLKPSWAPFGIPFMGKKVDSIEWAREEIRVTNEELKEKRAILQKDISYTTEHGSSAVHRTVGVAGREVNIPSVHVPGIKAMKWEEQTYPPVNGAFVLFHKQIAAHLAVQSLSHHAPYRMARENKSLEVTPEDIIWDNLGMNPYERKVRMALSWAATLGLIICWSIPVAFVGTISNIQSLCTTFKWLSWLCDLPKVVIGLIQGVLPSVLLAVLFMLLPIILRLLARFEGIPQRTGVELSLMDRFFIFEVIHGFLIVTLSSGLIKSVQPLIKNPTSVASILAHNLPGASTFFLTYVTLQGLSGTAGGFLRIASLVLYYVKLYILGSTPRSVYNIKYSPVTSKWGTLFPQTALIVVITLGYMVISPIINGLSCAAFVLFYFLYKYQYTWINDQPATSDTGGLFFPKALQQVFVGLYIQQICLCALFFLAQDENKKGSAIPEGALMVVLIVFTAFFNYILNNSYRPLINFLPLSIADRSFDPDNATPADAQEAAEANGLTDAAKREHDIRSKDYVNGSSRADGSESPKNKAGVSVSSPQPSNRVPTINPEADADAAERGSFTNNSRASSPSPSAQPVDPEAIAAGVDFTHPAAVEPQQTVWLPRDTLGLAVEAERSIREDGIDVTTEGAVMDAKGHVDVSAAPPEETRKSADYSRARSLDFDDQEEEEVQGRGWGLHDGPHRSPLPPQPARAQHVERTMS